MKPLKEIGTLIKPEFESMTQFEPFIQLSLQERRELVRRAIEAERRDEISDIEEWMEAQGL